MVRRMFKSASFIITIILLLLVVTSLPVLAGSLAISPIITEMEMLPGTTAEVVLSVENGLERSYSFHLAAAQLPHPREDYGSLPDLSWFNLNAGDIRLAPGERTWVTVELAIPDDESLVGQKWAANIEISCKEEPLLSNSLTILVSIEQAHPPRPDLGIGGGIIAVSMIGAVLWSRWRDRQRTEWATGLKTKHWLE